MYATLLKPRTLEMKNLLKIRLWYSESACVRSYMGKFSGQNEGGGGVNCRSAEILRSKRRGEKLQECQFNQTNDEDKKKQKIKVKTQAGQKGRN